MLQTAVRKADLGLMRRWNVEKRGTSYNKGQAFNQGIR